MHRCRGKNRHLIRRPAIESQDGRFPGNDSAFGNRKRRENPGRARDWDQFAVRIHAGDAANIRIERAGFLDVDRRADRANFDQAQDGVRVDQSRINMFPVRLDHIRTGRNRRVRPERGDLSILENNRAVRNVRTAHRMNHRAFDRDRFGLRRRRNRVGRARYNHDAEKSQRKKETSHSDASSMHVCLSPPLP